jgi:hypothetical protein
MLDAGWRNRHSQDHFRAGQGKSRLAKHCASNDGVRFLLFPRGRSEAAQQKESQQ